MKRREIFLKKLKRLVIKIGSSSLTMESGGLDIGNMEKFINEVVQLLKQNIEVILVTSGAIAAGLKSLNIKDKPADIASLQAAAAIGQVELMKIYGQLFSDQDLKVGQILLTEEDTTRREQYLNIKNTIRRLLDLKVIPIINENDSAAVDEIKFGDNDELAAMVAVLSEADFLIILSDVDGMYDKNPRDNKDAKLIHFIDNIGSEIKEAAGGTGSIYGSGGMYSKLKAAKICSFSGIGMIIANSRTGKVLEKIISGQEIGTFFTPGVRKKVNSFKKWIAFGVRTRGSITIDSGAVEAVVNKGKSILAVGITGVKGRFHNGDTLKVFSPEGNLIAKGISNFSSEEIVKIMSKNDRQIIAEFGSELCSEIIHRNCLVVFKE